MPSGVALQAIEGNTPQGSTSYERFMQAGISAGNAHTAGRRDNVRKHENKVAPTVRPTVPDWKCVCGNNNFHYKHAPTYRNEAARLLLTTQCSKCSKTRPGAATEHTHMAAAAVHTAEIPAPQGETDAHGNGFWAAPGNAFGLGAITADSDLHGRNVEAISNHIPSLCVECMAPTIDDRTGNTVCDACAGQARRLGRTRRNTAMQAYNMVSNGVVAVAVMHMAVIAARNSRTPAPATPFSSKYVSVALAVALLAVTISGARGQAIGTAALNNPSNLPYGNYADLTDAVRASPGRITPAELALLSEIGMHRNHCFVDSGCSTSIISDRTILRNIRKLTQQVPIAGLIGELGVQYSADMHIPVFDTSGKLAELVVPDVYYSPDSKYNLISCAQLEDLGYDVQFSKRQICTPTTSIAIARIGNVYALANAGHSVTHTPPRDHALPAVG